MDDPNQEDGPDHWTVDRVVNELCHNRDSAWMRHANLKPLDHQELIEQILRDNDIDGETLLDLREEHLKNDLEIKSFGQRLRLTKIINYLRRCSGRHSFSSSTSILHTTSASPREQSRLSREQSTHRVMFRTLPLKREAENAADDRFLDGLDAHCDHELGGQDKGSNLSGHVQRTVSGKGYVGSGEGKRRRIMPEKVDDLSIGPFFGIGNGESPNEHTERILHRNSGGKSTHTLRTTSDTESMAEDPKDLTRGPGVNHEIESELAMYPQLRLILKNNPPDEDQGLPLYGESDEEDRYVTEGSISDLEDTAALKTPDQLSESEVDAVIDETITEFRSAIRINKILKFQSIGYKQWKAMKDAPLEQSQLLKNAHNHFKQLLKRLKDLRDHIHDCSWTTIAEVKEQCENLYPTVEQIQEISYVLKVLQGTKEPPRPQINSMPKQKRISRKALPEGDETCDSDGDDLDEFVVSEEDHESIEESENKSAAEPEEYEWSSELDDQTTNTVHDLPIGPVRVDTVALPLTVEVAVSTPSRQLSTSSQQLVNPVESQNNGKDGVQQTTDGVPQATGNFDATQADKDIDDDRQPLTPSRANSPKTSFVDIDADDEGEMGVTSSAKRTGSAKKRILQDSIKRNPIKMPEFTESSDDGFSQGSDFDRSSRLPATSLRKHGRTSIRPIDLTHSSPPSLSDDEMEIRTPKLNAMDSNQPKSVKGKPQVVDQDIPRLTLLPKRLPDFSIVRISDIRTIKDARTALAKRVYSTEKDYAHFLLGYVKSLDTRAATRVIKNVISFLNTEGEDSALLQVSKKDREVAKMLTYLFCTYACTGKLDDAEDLHKLEDVEDASQEILNIAYECTRDMVSDFRALVVELLTHRINQGTTTQLSGQKHVGVESEIIDDTETGLDTGTDIDATDGTLGHSMRHGSASRKRTLHLMSANDIQSLAKHRVRAQARRKEMLAHMLEGATTDDGSALVPVNFKEPLVYLAPHIARAVKPHQIDGIQFMWRELIEDPKQQGCLLAHTMGLGKTMQVISVLVAISECNRSQDPKIRLHIPQRLRQLRILILCPVSLVSNWYDELLLWMPTHNTLGSICMIDQKCKEPYSDIRTWAEMGGVLIVPYTKLTSYCKTSKFRSGRTEEQNAEMVQWLLNYPSIVVADEAHALKNPESLKTVTAMKIKTKSRIALTGSPLSNHLEEYWGLINFVAPGYLADLRTFQRKFVDPINRSLTIDSVAFERRVGLKKMHMLKKILDPKVHRADITAIRSDLPDKTEFYITIPLTGLQKQAYQIYVQHFKDAIETQNAGGRVLTWISILSLLLNHPYCFVRKLEQAQAASEMFPSMQSTDKIPPKKPNRDADEDGILSADIDTPDDIDVSNDAEVMKVMSAAIQVFRNHAESTVLEDPALSHRSLVVKSIIEETMRVGEKILIFSHSLPTLDYLETLLNRIGCVYDRIDGTRQASKRQQQVKDFNDGANGATAFLISTKAGGLGLNVYGATRVVIYDYGWNPSWEEQAIGRAYRLGQTKPVFVYRFKTGGTYEDVTFNSTVFKSQLFSRIVDHKTFSRKGAKVSDAAKYLFEPTDPEMLDLSESMGKDPEVLDRVLEKLDCVRSIDLTETFSQDIDEKLTEQEILDADRELELERLQRENPQEYQKQRLAMDASRRAAVGSTAVIDENNASTLFAKFQAAIKNIPPAKMMEVSRQGSMIELPKDSIEPNLNQQRIRAAGGPLQPIPNNVTHEILDMDVDAQGCKTQ